VTQNFQTLFHRLYKISCWYRCIPSCRAVPPTPLMPQELNKCIHDYHLSPQSSLSSFPLPPPPVDPVPPYPPPPPPFFMAAVPIELGFGLLMGSSGSPKLSQKSFRSGSVLLLDRWSSAEPSTKRLKESAAPLAPVWIPWPTWAAVAWARAVNSDSAI
jgi:hypothetical protein